MSAKAREGLAYARSYIRPSRIVSGDVSELPAPVCCWHPALSKPTIQRTTHDHRKTYVSAVRG